MCRWQDIPGGAGCLSLLVQEEAREVTVAGVRYFGDYAGSPLLLEDPEEVVQGDRVTHLRFRVRRA
jgi:hypothetical protein